MRFHLLPFAPNADIDGIDGSFEFNGDVIDCQWSVSGTPGNICWPPPTAKPERQMSLWEHTCFEFFIGPEGETGYYEFNLSPSGHWNSFSFSDLRTGMAETPVLQCMTSSVETPDADQVIVSTRVKFRPDSTASRYRVGVSAVVEMQQGQRYYYALAHDGNRPDFHKRKHHRLLIS